ncbi:hypothetical protein OHA72_24285 [Dactylosporangium sp. NBC_01737]|uniref:hypothetical protein n=1 Tax=Dactylosporangium sp. NBC_01737 TaxID=2975959 RepID=UPI002E1063DA|nr:hypothetical protein OHA72_24285 [Dactylosporangium sp. NBC_01737]
MNAEFPFPFFGAGEATYFEWAEVCVRFAREPAEGERAAIARRVPPPLMPAEDEQDRVWAGPLLTVGSDQFAHMWIIENYPKEDDDETDDDVEGGFPFAAVSRVRRFNEDIEAWLRFAHEQCPILVAYRPEDGESGGTELSAWHDWSVARADEVLAAFDPAVVEAARAAIGHDRHPDGEAYVVRGILWMAPQRSSVKT